MTKKKEKGKMRVRIDLKIIIFLLLFCFTKQIDIYLTIMFFCVIHELGHIIVGLLLKMKPERLELMPYGLTVSFKVNIDDLNKKIKKGTLLELKKIIVAFSGPLLSLALAIIFLYIDPIYITKQDAVYSNILILLFNLLPLYPLDGGRILKSLIYIFKGKQTAEKYIYRISYITLIIITIVSSIAILYLKNIAIFLIVIFLWGLQMKEHMIYKNRKILYETIQQEMDKYDYKNMDIPIENKIN